MIDLTSRAVYAREWLHGADPARALLTSRPEELVAPPAIGGDRVIEVAWPRNQVAATS